MRKTILKVFAFGTACLLTAAAAFGAEPKPVLHFDFSEVKDGRVQDAAGSGLELQLTKNAAVKDKALLMDGEECAFIDKSAYSAWAKKYNKDLRDISFAFRVRFDEIGTGPAGGINMGVAECWTAADGTLRLKITKKPTELMAPLVLTGKKKLEAGKWYHIEFAQSMNQRRYILYIDGEYQAENDKVLLPEPSFGTEFSFGRNFKGAVGDYKLFDMALDSEELAMAYAPVKEILESIDKLSAALETAKNPALKKWMQDLHAQLSKYTPKTIAAQKRLFKAVANALEIAAILEKDPQGTISSKNVTAYVTPATTQALYLPYDLPENGTVTNQMEVVMAKDEFETSSVIVVPFEQVKKFTIQAGELRNGKHTLKAPDIKLVKRWYRTGGAWMSYHVDLRMRVLVPGLLVNDDKLIKVDEFRRTNELLMHYPTGDRYVNVSNFAYNREWLDRRLREFMYDAPTLQPLELTEAGRNQQYMVTFHTPADAEPGFYTGQLKLIADGRDAGVINVTVRVLPFVLPQPKTYYDTTRPFMSHVNRYDGVRGTLQNAKDFNLMHVSGTTTSRERMEDVKAIGYQTEIFYDSPQFRLSDVNNFGGPAEKMTESHKKQIRQMMIAPFLRNESDIEKFFGRKDFMLYRCQTSESGWYGSISLEPDEFSTLLNTHTRTKLFSHGMTDALPTFSPGIYDMDSATKITKDWAEIWHAADGRLITYAYPFPGPENPGLMRRALGIDLYLKEYDGHMMHGYISNQFNEFTKYPGGDGDYRTFCMAFAQKDGCINQPSIVGYREGFDDVRYATMMKTQAEKALKESKDELVRREAKRQLAWLQRIDETEFDLDSFRSGLQYRIMALMDLIQARKGK